MLLVAAMFQLPAQTVQVNDPVEYSQDSYSFEESMNADLFVKINQERVAKNLPELKYNFVMQNTIDQIAESIKTNMCHCYGEGNYVTENLYAAASTESLIADLSGYSKKNNPLKRNDISYVSIGISDDKDHYYFAIRTF